MAQNTLERRIVSRSAPGINREDLMVLCHEALASDGEALTKRLAAYAVSRMEQWALTRGYMIPRQRDREDICQDAICTLFAGEGVERYLAKVNEGLLEALILASEDRDDLALRLCRAAMKWAVCRLLRYPTGCKFAWAGSASVPMTAQGGSGDMVLDIGSQSDDEGGPVEVATLDCPSAETFALAAMAQAKKAKRNQDKAGIIVLALSDGVTTTEGVMAEYGCDASNEKDLHAHYDVMGEVRKAVFETFVGVPMWKGITKDEIRRCIDAAASWCTVRGTVAEEERRPFGLRLKEELEALGDEPPRQTVDWRHRPLAEVIPTTAESLYQEAEAKIEVAERIICECDESLEPALKGKRSAMGRLLAAMGHDALPDFESDKAAKAWWRALFAAAKSQAPEEMLDYTIASSRVRQIIRRRADAQVEIELVLRQIEAALADRPPVFGEPRPLGHSRFDPCLPPWPASPRREPKAVQSVADGRKAKGDWKRFFGGLRRQRRDYQGPLPYVQRHMETTVSNAAFMAGVDHRAPAAKWKR